jgi:hypothetical protein
MTEPKKNEQPKILEQMTLVELKALAYEQIVLSQQIQNNIIAIQAEITKRDPNRISG